MVSVPRPTLATVGEGGDQGDRGADTALDRRPRSQPRRLSWEGRAPSTGDCEVDASTTDNEGRRDRRHGHPGSEPVPAGCAAARPERLVAAAAAAPPEEAA